MRSGRSQKMYLQLDAPIITDADEIPYSSTNVLQIFRVRTETLNIPEARHGFLMNMYIDSNQYAIQFLLLLGSVKIYHRSKQSGIWGNWTEH